MKLLKIQNFLLMSLGAFCLLINSCTKDEVTQNSIESEIQSELGIDAQLDNYFSEYRLLKLDASSIFNNVLEQDTELKDITLIEGELSFTVKKSELSPNNDFYKISEDGKLVMVEDVFSTSLYLDNISIASARNNPFAMVLSESTLRAEYIIDDESFVLAPLSEFIKDDKSDQYVLYNNNAFNAPEAEGHECFVGEEKSPKAKTNEMNTAEFNSHNANITVVIDYSFYTRIGWNGSINYVNNAIYWASYRYNVLSGMPVTLRRGSGYILNQSYQYGLTFSWDPATYLNNFAAWLSSYGIGDDANMLFTSNHAHWGASYATSICGYYAVSLIEYHWDEWRRNNIVAHEMGHIMGVGANGHGPWGVMSWNSAGQSFDPESKSTILNYLGWAGWCL